MILTHTIKSFVKEYPIQIVWNIFLWICAFSILVLIDRVAGFFALFAYFGAMVLACKGYANMQNDYQAFKKGYIQK